MKTTAQRFLSRSSKPVLAMTALLGSMLALPLDATAQNVCIKQVSSAPTIDGVVASALPSGGGCMPDAVWAGVSPGEFQPGSVSPVAHLYLAYQPGGSTMAVGITVGGDEDLSDQDYVSLFFDADNSDSYNLGDFVIRMQATGSVTPITSGVDCDQTTGNVDYFEHDGNGWQGTSAPATITARLAYDFDSGTDPDDNLWNLEFSFPVGPSDFDLQTASPYFGLGGYVFVDDGHQEAPQVGDVRKWPGSITASPGIGAIDPAFSEPNATELADASLEDVCFDVNFTAANPWKINNEAASSYEAHIDPGVPNDFTVTFFFAGPGGTEPMSNEGTVRLLLRPYGNITTGTQYDWEKTVEVDAETVNAAKSVEFTFDFGNPPSNWSDFADIDFICATATLEDFQRDDDDTNNELYVNVNYFTTSQFTQPIYITAGGVPNLDSGEGTTLLLRAEMNNEIPAAMRGQNGQAVPGFGGRLPEGSGLFLLLLGLAGALLLVVLARHRLIGYRAAFGVSMLIMLGGVAACKIIDIGTDNGGPSARWSFANARELGLRPVEGEPGWYTLPIRQGEVQRLEVSFQDMPLPYETDSMRLEPARDGEPNMIRLPVEPGQVVSLFASGTVDLDGPDGPLAPTSANGFVLPEDGQPERIRAQRFLLRDGYYQANEYAGALIGSFDGFKTSFPVGRSTALVVPQQASTLSLAVNANQFAQITGAFDLGIIRPKPIQVPTVPTVTGDGTFHAPFRVNTWEVLTSLNIYTYYETTQIDEAGQIIARTRHPLGFTHQVIFDSHE